jgi:hypothetical protein
MVDMMELELDKFSKIRQNCKHTLQYNGIQIFFFNVKIQTFFLDLTLFIIIKNWGPVLRI